MSFTRAHNLTSCDLCGLVVEPGWRSLAAHQDAHYMARLREARQVRIDAATRAQSRCAISVLVGQTCDNGTDEAAPDLTPRPPLSTPDRHYRKEDA